MKYLLASLLSLSLSAAFSQKIKDNPLTKGFSTNILATVRYSTDLNLNGHLEKGKNMLIVGFDLPIYEKRSSAKESFDTWKLDKSRMSYKVDLVYGRYLDDDKEFFITGSLKYHDMNYNISELGKCIAFNTGHPILWGWKCVEGHKNIYSLKLQKVVPAIGIGMRHGLGKHFFILSDYRIGYSFIIKDVLMFRYLEKEITKVPDGIVFNIGGGGLTNDFINHGDYRLGAGKKQAIAVQINFCMGYKF